MDAQRLLTSPGCYWLLLVITSNLNDGTSSVRCMVDALAVIALLITGNNWVFRNNVNVILVISPNVYHECLVFDSNLQYNVY